MVGLQVEEQIHWFFKTESETITPLSLKFYVITLIPTNPTLTILCLFFLDIVLLCIPDWPGTCCVGLDRPQTHRDLLWASQMLGLKV